MLIHEHGNSLPKAERSIFHTHEPRDTKTKIHLVLVFTCFVLTFTAAIIFAEHGHKKSPLSAQKTALKEKNHGEIFYGKSE